MFANSICRRGKPLPVVALLLTMKIATRGVGRILIGAFPVEEDQAIKGGWAVMEWVVKLEARSGLGEVEIIEVGGIKRRVVRADGGRDRPDASGG